MSDYGKHWNMGSVPYFGRFAVLPCGHPRSLLVRSVESTAEYCGYCDMVSQRNDALLLERYYKHRSAGYDEALRSIAANSCCGQCQEAALVAMSALRREANHTLTNELAEWHDRPAALTIPSGEKPTAPEHKEPSPR